MNIVNFSLLCSISNSLATILSIVLFLVGIGIGIGVGFGIYAVVMNKKSKSAKKNADKILEDAYAQAEKIKKEQVEQANKEIGILKSTFEQ